MLHHIEAGTYPNEEGSLTSGYHILADSGRKAHGHNLSACVTKETGEDGARWYSVHFVDNITNRCCDLYSTNRLDKAELIEVLDRILRATVDIIASQPTKFKVGDIVEASWEGGRTSLHKITGIERDNPHGTWYDFADEDGDSCGSYGCFLWRKQVFCDEDVVIHWENYRGGTNNLAVATHLTSGRTATSTKGATVAIKNLGRHFKKANGAAKIKY